MAIMKVYLQAMIGSSITLADNERLGPVFHWASFSSIIDVSILIEYKPTIDKDSKN